MLNERGKLSEAEAGAMSEVIALKPDYAEAYNNLGIRLKSLEGLTRLKQAIGIQ